MTETWMPLTPEGLHRSGLAGVLVYPALASASVLLESRIAEFSDLGIESLCIAGPKRLKGVPILGMGYCGLVLRVRWRGESKVLKLRRWDAPCETLLPEAKALRFANQVRVGPVCRAASANGIIMDEIRGDRLIDWAYEVVPQLASSPKALSKILPERIAGIAPERTGVETVHAVLDELAKSAFRLDQLGLDHGELNCVASHAIVQGQSATLIDFSRASQQRQVSNVTALVQGLVIGTMIPKALAQYFQLPVRQIAIDRLRAYKQELNRDSFEAVRSLLKLQPR